MERRTFIKQSCLLCIGLGAGLAGFESCAGSRYATGTLTGNSLSIPLDSFPAKQNGKPVYTIVSHPTLRYPICVYKNGDSYQALWMQCSHQGAELQVSGDVLHCPAHGSEFNHKGEVLEGPAEKHLRSFPVKAEGNTLSISLA